ncbi:SPASM domain-containing protein [[Clostridium] innocuum]|uniref:radical SAM/SPASM domain-containing protein n=1 Tax=Clostridium innocuum TaxID=1522 RepID=UPI000D6B5EA3|nr:radical SAM protein [[Clostridium] innocuum]MCR0315834.1 SPASM domain-containing protein [[Clostridium] innocuum]MCR0370964.1 SPASM domain-containing protein [[Clostridium] innocuum]MCR0375581.1 SPASM domain-containing protein [[Clostridium] innocuum]MCR0560941.1 SPASM domain-containing protein [[Clostridium] innocuum]MCR0603715.1 SPASM domain-containing protein [[Clostridium] innocuum]
MEYRKSFYNFFVKNFENQNEMIAYNSYNNALGIIEKEKYELYLNNDVNEIKIKDKELYDTLVEGGFLVEESLNEIDVMKYESYKSRYLNDGLALTVNPFSGCNFRCIYCFELDRLDNAIKMSKEVQDKLIDYVKQNISGKRFVRINWFGGEPTIAFDVIERISRELIEICEANNVDYGASIITNGYLLNEDIIKKMVDCKIKTMQITLDGNKEMHDTRRVLKNGQGTFDCILNNVIKFAGKGPLIHLRVNSDKSNPHAYKDVINILKENNISDKVIVNLGKVYSDDTNNYSNDKCFSNSEFYQELFNFKKSEKSEEILLPNLKRNECASVNENSFVLDADGKLYKCWNEVGLDEYAFGNILDGVVLKGLALRYLNYNVFDNEQCRKCKFVPICKGGCNSIKKEHLDCCQEKYILEKLLNHIVNKWPVEN